MASYFGAAGAAGALVAAFVLVPECAGVVVAVPVAVPSSAFWQPANTAITETSSNNFFIVLWCFNVFGAITLQMD
jgi:hypothetical protein